MPSAKSMMCRHVVSLAAIVRAAGDQPAIELQLTNGKSCSFESATHSRPRP
jgi:hypothetical protein